MRVLITGVSGFAGSHLADFLLDEVGCEVWGTARSELGAADHLAGRIDYQSIDLGDREAVRKLLERCQPDRIYHLAAQTFVPASWSDPWPTLETNIRSQLNLLQGMVDLQLEARILCVASMEVYGKISPDELPISEGVPLRPDSPYGVSKATQDILAGQYFRGYGLHTMSARPSNHIGPRQGERFVVPAFAKQIAEIESGMRPPVMKVGNLSAKRDFVDVRDVVRAYYLLLENGVPGEAYNIGRGEAFSVQTLLDLLLTYTDLEIKVETDPARMRPSDIPIINTDISKIRAATGWEPRITFEESLQDILEDWRRRVGSEPSKG